MFDIHKIPSQKGRVVIVTGANAGLGFETALAFVKKDMKVVMACRNLAKAEAAKAKILAQVPTATIEIRQLDLSKLKSVRAFADAFLKDYQQLDLLINNAGIMIPPFSLTEDGFESQLGANYFGHFLLTSLLLPIITNTPNSRIVSLSSIAHKSGRIRFKDMQWKDKYSAFYAYAQSKLACLMFADELQRRLEKAGSNTISVAAHPGASPTDLMQYIPTFLNAVLKVTIYPIFTHLPDKAALPIQMAALDPSVKGGDYYGPQGFKDMKGTPGIAKRTGYSKKQDVAAQLWDASVELTGANYQF
jgi:NAD(P)-dependent dehydrogenase (short-subunit alcohol dehydrogenase family)